MMESKYTVPLKTIVEEMKLQPLHLSKNYDTALLTMGLLRSETHSGYRPGRDDLSGDAQPRSAAGSL